jgi:hypothetical protein
MVGSFVGVTHSMDVAWGQARLRPESREGGLLPEQESIGDDSDTGGAG